MVPHVFIRHPVFSSHRIPADRDDAIALRTPGLTVREAIPIIRKYAQPGSGLFVTDEHGVRRGEDEPLWAERGDTLSYRMEKHDMRTAEEVHEELSVKYMNGSEYPQVMGVGYLTRRDPLNKEVAYFMLSIDLDKKFYPNAVGEKLDAPPDGFPASFRNSEYCLPIEYCVSSMMYAQ